MNPKILLLYPNTSNEGVVPLAIAILVAIAKKQGFDVEYFETSFYKKDASSWEERERTGEFKSFSRENNFELLPHQNMFEDFYRKLKNYKPDILAVSANSLEYDLFYKLAEGFQTIKTELFCIVGGCHATIAPEDVIKNPFVNALCIGEGEQPWEEFLRFFKTGQDVATIKNLWVKTKSGIKKNPLRPLLPEDTLWEASTDFCFFDEKHFKKPFDGKVYLRGMIEFSRGCPYNCSYCVNSVFKDIYKGLGKWVRIRSLHSLQHGIDILRQRGCNMLQLQDENFFSIPYDRLEKFCTWYSEEIRLPLLLQTRPESVTDKKVKIVADMGIPVQISCGVESGSERILHDICNRRMSLNQIRNAFKTIKKYNLRTNAYTMLGFPTELREEVFQTIHLIREIKPDISVMSVFYPFKGVPLRKICLEKGYMSGTEKVKTFTDASILKNQPMSGEEIRNLRRTYIKIYLTSLFPYPGNWRSIKHLCVSTQT